MRGRSTIEKPLVGDAVGVGGEDRVGGSEDTEKQKHLQGCLQELQYNLAPFTESTNLSDSPDMMEKVFPLLLQTIPTGCEEAAQLHLNLTWLLKACQKKERLAREGYCEQDLDFKNKSRGDWLELLGRDVERLVQNCKQLWTALTTDGFF